MLCVGQRAAGLPKRVCRLGSSGALEALAQLLEAGDGLLELGEEHGVALVGGQGRKLEEGVGRGQVPLVGVG